MAEHVLIDTSVWVRTLRRDAPPSLVKTVADLIGRRCAATTGAVMLEVLAGVRGEREYQETLEELFALHYLPADPAWPRAWRLAFTLRRNGVTAPSADLIVAAVAIVHGCRLLHADEHFTVIARHSSLRAEMTPV